MRAKAEDIEALAAPKAPGATPKLTPERKAAIPALLLRSAESVGYLGDPWTRPHIAEVINAEYGHQHSDSQIRRLLKDWGWKLQKPTKPAKQSNGEKIQRLKDET